MKKLLILTVFLMSSMTYAKTITNFYPSNVTCTNDVSGTYGQVLGEGGAAMKLDLRIAKVGHSRKEYRNSLCEAMAVAAKNKTAVDVEVKELTVKEPEGDSHILLIQSIRLGHRPSL